MISEDKNYKTWKELLEFEWEDFVREGTIGRFSDEKNQGAKWFGENIAKFDGKILDIGCGVLPLPIYMTYNEKAIWYGIDPIVTDVERKFNFKNAVAEDIPFDDEFFDAVVYATSLNHLCNIEKAICETNRVLKQNGYVILWAGLAKEESVKYQNWIKTGGKYDKRHLYGFTRNTILEYFKQFKNVMWIQHHTNGNIIVFQKV